MISEDNKIEIIELYLKGELKGEMLNAFEKRIQEDSGFRELVALEKEVLEGLDALALDALQKDLDEIHKDEDTPGSVYADMRKTFEQIHEEVAAPGGKAVSMQPHRKTYWSIAAVVALLLVAGIAVYFIYEPSNDVLITYVTVREADPEGNLARGGFTDSLQVMIYPPTGAYTFHYQLSDNLKLYGDFKPGDLQIFYSPDTEQYFLEADNQRYALRKNDEIVRLE